MRLSGLAKFKSQSRCLMRGSGKGGKIPATSWYFLSEMGAQANVIAGHLSVDSGDYGALRADY